MFMSTLKTKLTGMKTLCERMQTQTLSLLERFFVKQLFN